MSIFARPRWCYSCSNMHGINTLDQWKKLNQLARHDPALAAKINTDAIAQVIQAAMFDMTTRIPNVTTTLHITRGRIVPMPKALYFGHPCPFGRMSFPNLNEAHASYDRWAELISPVRSLAMDVSEIPSWLQNVVTYLEDVDAHITIDALFGHPSPTLYCVGWRGLAALLRDRCWTIVRANRSTDAATRMRSTK